MTALPLSESCCGEPAAVWLWPGQAIYVGPALDLDLHAGSVACLAVGLDDAFTVHRRAHVAVAARTALIAPRLTHRIQAHGQRMLFCYLDPSSARQDGCAALMRGADAEVRFDHRAERALIERAPVVDRLRSGAEWLDLAAPGEPTVVDARIQAAARRLRDETDRSLSAAELAADCGLSTSRFLHLFVAQTGTSFRRYRLWSRMLHAGRLLSEHRDLTTAAVGAGFATPSHLSSAFHAMFGLPPSRLLAGGVRFVDGAEAVRTIAG